MCKYMFLKLFKHNAFSFCSLRHMSVLKGKSLFKRASLPVLSTSTKSEIRQRYISKITFLLKKQLNTFLMLIYIVPD